MHFVLLGEWNPQEYVIDTRGRLFNPTRGKHVLKHAESHSCEVNTLWKLACNFSTFATFLKGIHFGKSLKPGFHMNVTVCQLFQKFSRGFFYERNILSTNQSL